MVLINRKFDVDLIDLKSDNLPKVYKYIDIKKSEGKILESRKISSLYKLLFNDRIFLSFREFFFNLLLDIIQEKQ